MPPRSTQLTESINLIQGYYSYFLLSLYTDSLMKQGKIHLPPQDLILKTGDKNAIKLNTKRIITVLTQIQKSPTAKNVYGYLSYISSIKGLFGTFMDMHNTSSQRKTYLKKRLGQRYESYIHCIRICRNLLTHQHTADIRLSKYDLISQKEKLQETDKRIISLTFHYKDIFQQERTGADSYGFHISINTTTLHTKRTLFDIIDEHTMFMLAESVFNLADTYKKINNYDK